VATVGSTAYVVDDVSGVWLIDVSVDCCTQRAPDQTFRGRGLRRCRLRRARRIASETDTYFVSLWLAGCL